MGKRSEGFEKIGRNFYPTPVKPILPMVKLFDGLHYYEPCAGDGKLIRSMKEAVPTAHCMRATEIEPRAKKVGKLTIRKADASNPKVLASARALTDTIITNPPWDWAMLEPLLHAWLDAGFNHIWVLLSSDFKENLQSAELLHHCFGVYPVGRVKWIEDSDYSGKDNCNWLDFSPLRANGPTFHPRKEVFPR